MRQLKIIVENILMAMWLIPWGLKELWLGREILMKKLFQM